MLARRAPPWPPVPGRVYNAEPIADHAAPGTVVSERTISHYRLLERLGEGGMGVVYKAEDRRLHRFVALKLLSDRISDDPIARDRFHREAEAASALNHPGICTIYDVGEEDGHAF